MEVIQMESTVYKELMEKIDGIAAYVRKSEKRMSEENAEILLDNEQVAALLQISKRTLQLLHGSWQLPLLLVRG